MLYSIIMGGQSQSSTNKDEAVLDHFSADERKILEQYFKDGSWDQDKIKVELINNLPPEIFENAVKYFNNESTASKDNLWLQKSVLKLTKGTIEELSRASFSMISGEKSNITNVQLNKILVSFLLSMNVQIRADLTDCENFATLLTQEFPKLVNEDQFSDLLHRNSLLVDVLQNRFYICFFGKLPEISNNLKGSMPVFVPTLLNNTKAHSDLSLATLVYVNSKLPLECQYQWRLLYSSTNHGESFSKLCSNITAQGPVIVIVTDSDGHKFGGFVSVSCTHSAQFQGDRRSFLFSLFPKLEAFAPTGYNDHFMYLNIGQETMPNGFGMGGQHDFFGLWIDSEFGTGHSRAKPSSTTYGSPQLSKEEHFKIHKLEVWGVGEPPKQDEDMEDESVLDKHMDAQALLEIAGKSRVSEGLREADPKGDIPQDKELYHAHDPMQ